MIGMSLLQLVGAVLSAIIGHCRQSNLGFFATYFSAMGGEWPIFFLSFFYRNTAISSLFLVLKLIKVRVLNLTTDSGLKQDTLSSITS